MTRNRTPEVRLARNMNTITSRRMTDEKSPLPRDSYKRFSLKHKELVGRHKKPNLQENKNSITSNKVRLARSY